MSLLLLLHGAGAVAPPALEPPPPSQVGGAGQPSRRGKRRRRDLSDVPLVRPSRGDTAHNAAAVDVAPPEVNVPNLRTRAREIHRLERLLAEAEGRANERRAANLRARIEAVYAAIERRRLEEEDDAIALLLLMT